MGVTIVVKLNREELEWQQEVSTLTTHTTESSSWVTRISLVRAADHALSNGGLRFMGTTIIERNGQIHDQHFSIVGVLLYHRFYWGILTTYLCIFYHFKLHFQKL